MLLENFSILSCDQLRLLFPMIIQGAPSQLDAAEEKQEAEGQLEVNRVGVLHPVPFFFLLDQLRDFVKEMRRKGGKTEGAPLAKQVLLVGLQQGPGILGEKTGQMLQHPPPAILLLPLDAVTPFPVRYERDAEGAKAMFQRFDVLDHGIAADAEEAGEFLDEDRASGGHQVQDDPGPPFGRPVFVIPLAEVLDRFPDAPPLGFLQHDPGAPNPFHRRKPLFLQPIIDLVEIVIDGPPRHPEGFRQKRDRDGPLRAGKVMQHGTTALIQGHG